uniref:Uncharacterized protein n=1 Tax=Anguilla anguilla TaxID=7936 RepID=A0A0E9V559_ANGAN
MGKYLRCCRYDVEQACIKPNCCSKTTVYAIVTRKESSK